MDPGLGYLLSVAFALLFATAATHKWRAPARFAATVAAYRLGPRPFAAPLAWAILMAEPLIALAILSRRTHASAAVAGGALLVVYAAGMGINLARGRTDLDCGCTGPAARRAIAPWMVGRNVGLAALLALTVPAWKLRSLDATDAVTILAGATALALLYFATDQLIGEVMPRTASLRRGA